MGQGGKPNGKPTHSEDWKWPINIYNAAIYLGISYSAIKKAIERGRLVPTIRSGEGRGRGHRFERETLEKYKREVQAQTWGKVCKV